MNEPKIFTLRGEDHPERSSQRRIEPGLSPDEKVRVIELEPVLALLEQRLRVPAPRGANRMALVVDRENRQATVNFLVFLAVQGFTT